MRSVLTVIIIALVLCGNLVATLAASPAQSIYRSSGSPHPDEVRDVVMSLRVGQYVSVKLSSGEAVQGHIRDITDDQFVLLLDRRAAPVDIAYGDVRHLKPILEPVPLSPAPSRTKIVIGVVVTAILAFASYTLQGCGKYSHC